MSNFLIAGLGNIGNEYTETRHNIGFKIVEELAQRNKVAFSLEKMRISAAINSKEKM